MNHSAFTSLPPRELEKALKRVPLAVIESALKKAPIDLLQKFASDDHLPRVGVVARCLLRKG